MDWSISIISRDPKELHKPVHSNAAVLRFFRYFQAARDGQDKGDCIRLYTGCDVLGSELWENNGKIYSYTSPIPTNEKIHCKSKDIKA